MRRQILHDDYRALLDAQLTELALYAKELCPEALVEASAVQYEDEDGRVEVFPPPGLSEAEEERIEHALGERSAEIFAQTGLYIPCAILDATTR
jgi:hypothetical protein